MADAVALRGEAAEVARAEAQALFARAGDGSFRDALAELLAELDDGEVAAEETLAYVRPASASLTSRAVCASSRPRGSCR